ncbi:MAG: cobalt-precorrin-5B (C(1))-methyltransferase [Pseudomonadota bacterium]
MAARGETDLRTGFTTGACATAAAKAAASALRDGRFEPRVTITLPRGERPSFELVETALGPGWARAAVQKDAGDDPDVTHGALIQATVRHALQGTGLCLLAGEGVGTVTRPGLPVPPGAPAINPVPRRMITEAVRAIAPDLDLEVEISVPGGAALATRTWNPRLGIEGGLSILGTTGIVKPYSCAAWIASIHRGIDVARAGSVAHAAASTGSTSETVVQHHYALPDHALLDMGDFAGGLLKYLRRHPLPRLTIAGGFGKLTKLAQGAVDLHSARSQVDFDRLAARAEGLADPGAVGSANTAQQALEIAGPELAARIAADAKAAARVLLAGAPVRVDVMVVDRQGRIAADTAAP